jgi:DNA replication protein DnaC
MGFVGAATNLIITGPTGAGKTYLACVLGVEACKQTFWTCYIRMPDMLGHFQTHKDNLRKQVRYRKKLGNYKVLIIDEWLNYKINEKESKFIYELVEQRCGNNPTIFQCSKKEKYEVKFICH